MCDTVISSAINFGTLEVHDSLTVHGKIISYGVDSAYWYGGVEEEIGPEWFGTVPWYI